MFNIFPVLPPQLPFIIAKIFFLSVNLLLLIFLFVVLRQVNSMGRIVFDSHDSVFLNLLASGLLIFSISLFLAALVIL